MQVPSQSVFEKLPPLLRLRLPNLHFTWTLIKDFSHSELLVHEYRMLSRLCKSVSTDWSDPSIAFTCLPFFNPGVKIPTRRSSWSILDEVNHFAPKHLIYSCIYLFTCYHTIVVWFSFISMLGVLLLESKVAISPLLPLVSLVLSLHNDSAQHWYLATASRVFTTCSGFSVFYIRSLKNHYPFERQRSSPFYSWENRGSEKDTKHLGSTDKINTHTGKNL